MFERVDKVVIRGPFVAWPRPPWFTDHRTALPLMQELPGSRPTGGRPASADRLAGAARLGGAARPRR